MEYIIIILAITIFILLFFVIDFWSNLKSAENKIYQLTKENEQYSNQVDELNNKKILLDSKEHDLNEKNSNLDLRENNIKNKEGLTESRYRIANIKETQCKEKEELLNIRKQDLNLKELDLIAREKEYKIQSRLLNMKEQELSDKKDKLQSKEHDLMQQEENLNNEKESFKNDILYNSELIDNKLKWYKEIIDSIYSTDVSYRIKNNYFIKSTMYPKYQESLATDRAKNARKSKFDITVNNLVEINASIYSKSSGKTYQTTLESCTCEDFRLNKSKPDSSMPCKHMLALAFSVNAFVPEQSPEKLIFEEISEEIKKQEIQKEKNDSERQRLRELESDLENKKQKFKKEKNDFNTSYKEKIKYLEIVEKSAKEKLQTFPYLADIIAKHKLDSLNIKIRDDVTKKDMIAKFKSLSKQVAMLENQLAIYEYNFPVLEELKTIDVNELEKAIQNADGTGFNYRWLSEDEYAALTSTEKQQKWIERYFHSRSRSAWEAGIKYERYIGYLCEKEGYGVQYTGALLKLEDMGRDLIVTKKNTVYIVQCKRFSENKEIHENHIFQLYGSVYHYKSENPNKKVIGVFVTSSKLSEIACACANELSLQVFENIKFNEYPCIKCNISSNGEKIYHLPFDQQYDNTNIGKHQGEVYVSTVQEAQKLGFRHAMKHTFTN